MYIIVRQKKNVKMFQIKTKKEEPIFITGSPSIYPKKTNLNTLLKIYICSDV